jgi:YegS/Rv2252/BmrU family lipid kinase
MGEADDGQGDAALVSMGDKASRACLGLHVIRALGVLDAFDRRLFQRLTRRERRIADLLLRRVSNAANRSLLWLSIALLMALFGGRQGRRAAGRGAIAISITSTLVNLPLKYLARRDRPRLRSSDRPLRVKMPGSFSFPSGHSASAFAFTTATALEDPRFLPAVLLLATSVAYSRLHLRVHYPLDVLAGAMIGTGMGLASGVVQDGVRRWWDTLAPVPEQLRPPTNRLVLISSPRAGSAGKLPRARRAMQREGLTVTRELAVHDLETLAALLDENGERPLIVVAAGGDGTVGAVADALVGSRAILGIIPLGTSNDFARSMDIPLHVEAAVRLLARGPVRSVDVGKLVTGSQRPRHFVHAAAVGLNVAFARFATRADLRRRLGRLSYAVAAALALRERPVFDCEVRHSGGIERLRLVHLSVVNAPVFAGFLDLRIPNASPEDQTLHVIMIEQLPILRLLRSAFYPAIGVHRRIRGFRLLAVSQISVQTQQPMDVTLDGEVRGKLPGTFEVVPSALQMLAPVRPDANDH